MKREDIREITMQLVYQMDMTEDFRVADLSIVDENVKAAGKKQAAETLAAVQDHHEEIDDLISKNLDKWSIERIAKTDLAILRTAVAEMMYVDSIPSSVSINEAVSMTKKFAADKDGSFVNGVLGAVAKSLKGDK